MTRDEAYAMDRGHGAYSDQDPLTGKFNVYGAVSLYIYASYDDVGEASDAGVALHEELIHAGLN
jgi:hypothetical protein